MAAAALRSAARKVCGGSFERSQAYFTTAASAALKEEQGRLLLPRISRGGSSPLHRFSSSESQNVLNNSKGAKPAATVADDIIPPDSPFWKMKVEIPLTIWEPQHPYYVHHKVLWAAGTLAMCYGIAYAVLNYLPRHRLEFVKPTRMNTAALISWKPTRMACADVHAVSTDPSAFGFYPYDMSSYCRNQIGF